MSRFAILAASAVLAGLFFLGKSAKASSPDAGGGNVAMGDDAVRRMAASVEKVVGPWPGLADYLVATAWFESRFNPSKCYGTCQYNSARGLYQMRTKTGKAQAILDEPSSLLDPAVATAAAAWNIVRLARNWTDKTVDWKAVRRGWRLPSLVPDFDESEDGSAMNRKNFEQSLRKNGIGLGVMDDRAVPCDLVWDGLDTYEQVLAQVREDMAGP